MICPVDYGFINGTTSMDAKGIDIFSGEEKNKKLNGIICTVDLLKKDSEIKIIYECNQSEINSILNFLNSTNFMRAIFIANQNK